MLYSPRLASKRVTRLMSRDVRLMTRSPRSPKRSSETQLFFAAASSSFIPALNACGVRAGCTCLVTRCKHSVTLWQSTKCSGERPRFPLVHSTAERVTLQPHHKRGVCRRGEKSSASCARDTLILSLSLSLPGAGFFPARWLFRWPNTHGRWPSDLYIYYIYLLCGGQ